MLSVNRIYKHKKMTDVSFKILRVVEEKNEHITYVVQWHNDMYNFFIDSEIISIKKKDLINYSEVEHE